MSQFKDPAGVDFTASEQASVDQYQLVMQSYLESRNQTMGLVDEILKQDEEMPMASCLRAYLLKFASDPRFATPIQKELSRLQQLRPLMNRREKYHLHALETLLANQPTETIVIIEQLLVEYPKDIFALKIAQHLYLYAGKSLAMRDSMTRAATHWDGSEAFYSFLLGMQSFAFEEAGDYTEAEALGRRAVELNPKDQWATHAVAHVMQMQERFNEGVQWTGNLLPTWQHSSNFVFHVHWHKALFHLGEGDPQAALSIYDDQLTAPLNDDFYLDLCNAASLLWKLDLIGINVADRWQALAAYADRAKDDELVFCSLHYLMVPARLGQFEQTEAILKHFRHWAKASTSQGQIAQRVGLPLAEAIVNIAKENYKDAASTFDAIENDIISIGGSHAQRSIFHELRAFAQQHATSA